MADEKEPKPQSSAAPAEGAKPSGGGLQEFLFQFLKANPDLAREMSTRMNAVIHGQQLQGLKGAGAAPPMGGQPQAMGQPPQQMAGDVIPMAGERSMGPGETPDAAGFATGQQTAPNVQSIGTPTLRQWLDNVKARQIGPG